MKVAASVAASPPLEPDTYIYEVIPFGDRLVSISSDDSLRLIEPQTLQHLPGCTSVHDGVTCLKPIQDRGVLTAGRNGVVKCTDLRTRKTVQEISTDGLINIYDTTITDEDDALTQVLNHGSSIAHAGFLSDHEVYGLSHDEIFCIFDTNDIPQGEAYESGHAFGDLRPQLHCEYLVDLVRSDSTAPVFGAGSHRSACSMLGTFPGLLNLSARYLDLISLERLPRWSFNTPNAVRLPGAHGEEIVRSMCFSGDVSRRYLRSLQLLSCQQSNAIFTGGEDGIIRAWRVTEESADAGRGPPTKIEGQKKRYGPDKSERARFRPY
ncbi:MAG: hypothetical protein LQ344_001794 [Seirophora lacunosa]|nr:MAG: hypothetical protein LQ344_001794 [Seirophora lacunosa]